MPYLRKNGCWHFVSRKIIHGEDVDCSFLYVSKLRGTVLVSFERFQREDYYAQKKQKRIGAYDGG